MLADPGGEDQLAIRATGVLVRRLVHHGAATETPAMPLAPTGTVLVTGGTGGLGAEVARWLAHGGAPRLLLTSRRGPDAPGAGELAAELAALGTHTDIVACDVADREQMAAVLAAISAEHPLTGVVHTAGVAQAHRPLDDFNLPELADVLAAKTVGAANLDALVGDRPLELFVLFSSIAGVWGSGGQGAYGAANAYLDALAENRRGRGLHATSIAWGAWADTGMAADGPIAGYLARQGLGLLPPGAAIGELARALNGPDASVTVAEVDWEHFFPVFTSRRASPLLSELSEIRPLVQSRGVAAPDTAFLADLRTLTAGEQHSRVLELVRAEAARVLGHGSAGVITVNRAFREMGFDSLAAVELRRHLAAVTGLDLPATMVFDHPSPADLAEHLLAEIGGGADTVESGSAAPGAVDEPIAIIAMSCRLPGGVRTPEQLWELLIDGVDAISEFPTDRGWDTAGLFDPDPDQAGRTYSIQGGFLHDAAEFDPDFFGISPREALTMDPQQRLLLETAWETFERAGMDPHRVRGTRTGAFIGSSHQEYGAATGDGSEGHLITGTIPSVLSGRISYVLGLQGPAVTVDTACSSSMVALHLACQSLRSGESTLALAGGATVMTTPDPFVAFSRQRALAVDGRCKAFSDGADGMSLAEGVGLLLLERLSDAQLNGHDVLAVVRGSAINQDGASNGLTAPNGPAQQRVILDALAGAGLSTGDIDAIDAHGTGTALGDPIEVQALQATYGRDRERPLLLGSVKSNIGHTQSAAGVASVIKMVLAMQHGVLPATLHAGTPSTHVDWSAAGVRLLAEQTPWPASPRPRRAAVSSFGISGTNSHAILEQAPPADEPAAVTPGAGPVPWVLSAAGPEALPDQAARLVAAVEAGDLDAYDVAHSLSVSRALLDHRAVVVGTDRDELLAGARSLAAGHSAANVVVGTADSDGRLVFVFPGQGAQWAGMGGRLLVQSPVFAARIAECAAALAPWTDWSLLDVLREADGAPSLERVDVVQPASFAVMVALAQVWQSYGVRPDAVLGHSQGEIAAAVVAGVLSLQDGAQVVTLRSQAIARTLAGHGSMTALGMSLAEAETHLDRYAGQVSVAAVNGPRAIVISGEPDAVQQFAADVALDGIRSRAVAVDYASHSAQVELLEDELSAVLAGVRPQPTQVPFYSTVTGRWEDGPDLDASYWYRNLRQTVGFEPAVRALLAERHHAFVEVSSHPVLTGCIHEVADAAETTAVAVGSLRRRHGDLARFLASAGELFVRGGPVDFAATLAAGRRVALPTYGFAHERFWIPRAAAAATEPDAAEARFWAAVDQGDVAALTRSLDIDEDALGAVLPALSTWRRRRRDDDTVDSWRHRIAWRPAAVSAASLTGIWLLVTAGSAADDTVAAALAANGATVVRRELDETDGDLLADLPQLTGIVSTLAFAEQPSTRTPALTLGLALTIRLIQALDGVDAPLWCLTQGGVSTGRVDRLTSPAQAQIHGVGWTAALEHPHRWGGVVDLPATIDDRAGQRLAAVLAAAGGEDQLAVRASGVLVRRILPSPATGAPRRSWTPRGTTLLTGGTGTLAPHVARWLAGRGAQHIVLVSRRGSEAPGAGTLVAELAELGTTATHVACDITDRDAVAAMLAGLDRDGHLVRAVVHAAACIELEPLADTSLEAVARVVDAKVNGARHLDELLGDRLDAFVLFSSTAGMWGSGRHAAYVAANAYLGALAENRRARGLSATAVSWGIWSDDLRLDRVDPEHIIRSGLRFMDPALALSGLGRALDDDETAIAVADVDWPRYHSVYTTGRPTHLFDEIPEVHQVAGRTAGAPGAFATRLRTLAAAERAQAVLEVVRAESATVLGRTSSDALTGGRAFRDLGFDSLTAVDLRNRLAAVTGLTLPSTVVFDHPTPRDLVAFLLARMNGDDDRAADTLTPAGAAADEPIAIIAMSCRYPGGVTSPEELWELVHQGADVISPFPTDRGWDVGALYDPDPAKAGRTYSTQGGFLHDVSLFDHSFFGISPREALAMDPQQRIILETAWEAFERAGIDPATVRGSRTGTFIGSSYNDYAAVSGRLPQGIEGHAVTGTIGSVLSGRVSYLFGLEGPAVTVDTACSSSLVALHLACQSLRTGESSMALVGGVAVMATPDAFVGFSRQRAMAPDGRCKAYSEAADGMSLAEGVGLLLVEKLSDARRNGHEVLAVVRGSAINQDGASNGLTAPSGPSQQRVIRQALANAGLTAAEVDAVEGHGTGTALGDPIEAQALLATYGQDRETPLLLGSVKSNIGHTQMASGVASVIKMVQALRTGRLPRTLHVDQPSSHVDWSSGAIDLLTDETAWPQTGRPRRAAVSSFGLSGTNAHTILEQAPDVEGDAGAGEPPVVLVPLLLSAKEPAALAEQAIRLRERVTSDPGARLGDLAFSLATSRAAFEHRAAIVTDDRDDLLSTLDALAAGQPAPGLLHGRGSGEAVAFLFAGQGAQRSGMGAELYRRYPAFADALDAVLVHLDGDIDRPLRDLMFGDADEALQRTEFTQPALFAYEVALARLVQSLGVTPDYLAGHSVGEIAAAHLAGVLSLADACTLVAARGRLMQDLPASGAMVAVEATEDEVAPLLGEEIAVAAVNGPRAIVLSGAERAVSALTDGLAADGRRTRRLAVSHAFHSPLMEPMLEHFRAVVTGLNFMAPSIPIVSTVTGRTAGDEITDPEYWVRHARATVRFADAVTAIADAGVAAFLEIGPDGALCGLVRQSSETAAVPAGRRDRGEEISLVTALGSLHVHGAHVDWNRYFAGSGTRRIDLPTYAFQRVALWPEPARPAADQVDADFWAIVDDTDPETLAGELKVDAASVNEVLPALSSWRRRRRQQSQVDGWRYQPVWKPLPRRPADALPGTWLLVLPDATAVPAWAAQLGMPVLRVGDDDRSALAARLSATPATGVLSLLAEADGDAYPGVPRALSLTTLLVQALGDAGSDARLWCLTRGAVAVDDTDPVENPEQGALWGLGRVIAQEQPARWGGLVDLPAEPDPATLERLMAVLADAGEDQVALRGSAVFARRLVRPGPARTANRPFTPTGTTLITGGTGALGTRIARWLAAAGAPHLLLVSRRGPDAPGVGDLVGELTALGTRVSVVAGDAADRDALAAALATVPPEQPLSAVFHAAGLVLDGVIDALTPQRLAPVLHAKMTAAANLHALTAAADLSAFVLFSSTAATFGAPGQGNYAAANAYLDALAEHRRHRGLVATSVAWGPWASGGMVADPAVLQRIRRGGYAPMATEAALSALGQAIENGDTLLTVADIDFDRFVPAFAATRANPFVRDLPEVRRILDAATRDAGDESALRRQLTAAGEPERLDLLLTLVRGQVAAVLGHGDAQAVAPDRAFKDLGFDSLTTVEIRNALAVATGLTLPATMVYDYPTPVALTAFLLAELLGQLPEAEVAPIAVADDDPIVIVGMGCRFPGGVRNPDDLWSLLEQGRDAITAFPDDRGWDLDGAAGTYGGVSATRHGGFLDRAADFDAAFFGISPREALAMDPQQRQLLETTWEALEHAGIDPATLRGHDAGVFVGTNGQDYTALLMRADADVLGHVATGTTASVMSGRLSYTLGLQGPAVTVDTACSSSLVAVHLAEQSLRAGECSLALAGGVSVMSTPAAFVEFSAQGGLAPDGRCKAFSADADGTAWSEGVGVVVLERLSDARRLGHEVWAVVRGSAVNQDGASNGLTAPNGPAQQRVIRQALATAGLPAGAVDAVEAHGTGTELGDPIEAQALLATYGRDRDHHLLLGSVKSNLGHTQAAAGMAGLQKMVLAMRHGVLPRTLHVAEPSSHVDWSGGTVDLVTRNTPWPQTGRPRRAAVSAFGVSGTNAHLIVEEPAGRPAEIQRAEPPIVPLVVSAKTAAALDAQLEKLDAAGDLDRLDAGYTLAVGREAFGHRAVVLAAADGSRQTIRAVADGDPGTALLFTGQGAQRPAMGRELYRRFPAYAAAFDEVLAQFDDELRGDLRALLISGADAGEASINETRWTQPALFALEVALFRLLESWGVRPAALAGHSIGELAAAHVAGVFGLGDACRLVAARGRLMQALPAGGAMIALEASEDEVRPLLTGGMSIAAVNGPDALVIGGDEAEALELAEVLAGRGRRTRRLTVSHAFHSPLMEPMLAEFGQVVATVEFQEPRIPLVSTVTGAFAGAGELTRPGYWVEQARATVRFADAVRTLDRTGIGVFAEVGPDGVLTALARQVLDGRPTVAVATLRADRDEETTLLKAVAQLHVSGSRVDWPALFAGTGARRTVLPTYPFQHRRFWPEVPAGTPVSVDAADAEFWSAVDNQDVATLASTLELSDDKLGELVPALSNWRRRRRQDDAVDAWNYEVAWKPLIGAAATPAGRWLVVVPAEPDDWTRAAMTATGDDPFVLTAGDADRPDLTEQLRVLPTGFAGVLSLLALQKDGLALSAALVQALGDAGVDAPLWCATREAVAVGRSETADSVVQAGVWGLGRVAAIEHPQRWGGLVDLPATLDARTLTRLSAVLAGGGEDQVAVRASGTYGRRLVPCTGLAAGTWQPRGTVLITGGTNAVGRRVALWAAGRGAEHLLLTGDPETPAAVLLRAELHQLGAQVTIAACDVADGRTLGALLESVAPEFPLTAVVHTDGRVRPGPLDTATSDDLEALFSAQVRAAENLDALQGDRPLDAFVLFATIGGVWGLRDHGAGAAAEAALEALARRRRSAGRTASVVYWGAWADSGMLTDESVAQHLRASGLPPMDPELALAALGRVVAGGRTAVTVADIGWDRFVPAFTGDRPSRLFDDIPAARDALKQRSPAEPAGAGAIMEALRWRIRELPRDEQRVALVDVVVAQAASVLGHTDADEISLSHAFKDLGFDSLTAVELRSALAGVTGLALPASLVFDYPTPAVLADYLLDELTGHHDEPAAAPAVVARTGDPVVIVGMSCRYPGGVRSPEDLWQLLTDERDVITDFPADRGWDLGRLAHGGPDGRGASSTLRGGFLDDVADFDPGFFGISAREAIVMDPQQRQILEVAWEGIERAGIDPGALHGTETGVFVGGATGDYRPPADTRGHQQTAQAGNLLSGRLSYAFGLQGPAVTVDTACSSSLVALHLATQALRAGECTLALAGGVTVMSSPTGFVEFSEMGALSADGRCKAFAESADGTGWSEGVGMLVLERLSDAQANGHQVLAVVRGSAINQDGASNGLTAPNGPSQRRVISRALADAQLAARDVDAVEGHGTGTMLGDPIEGQALLATYGQDREHPLLLGSVKSNIGHTQSASGVAGVIKMVQAMRHGVVPKTLHVEQASSRIDWAAGAVELTTAATAWPETGRVRRAAVSSFGASGTNAHVILEQAPAAEPTPVATTPPLTRMPIIVSARTSTALHAQTQHLAAYLQASPGVEVLDVAYSLATTRSRFEHRAVLLADESGLTGPIAESTAAPAGKLGLLFTGQGSQRCAMGKDLHKRFPVYADALDAVVAHLDVELDRPLYEVLFAAEDSAEAALIHQTRYTQPALFAVEVALFHLVRSWGIRPDMLAGHSIGEIAAAHVAGVFSLADACRLVAARGRLMQALPTGGAMLAMQAGEQEVLPFVRDDPARLAIAAVNAADSVVVAGDAEAVHRLGERFAADGRRTKSLQVSHAFHSPHMDAMLDDFAAVAATLSYSRPSIPLVANVTGTLASAEQVCDPGYWVRHAREAVRFADGVQTMRSYGVRTFLELGPDAVLTAMAQLTADADAVLVPALRRDEPEEQAIVGALARLHTRGVAIDWAAFFAGHGAQLVELPTYPFEHRRFWPDDEPATGTATSGADAEFWSAVERADVPALAADLDVDDAALAALLPALSTWHRRRRDESTVDGCLYRAGWKLVNAVPAGRGRGPWLAVVPAEPGASADAALAALGDDVIRLELPDDALDRAALADRLAAYRGVVGVVSLLAGRPGALILTTVLIQALGDAGVDAPLWCVTSGAVSTGPADPVTQPRQAALWGLGRVAALEYPQRWGGLIDLPAELDQRAAGRFAGVLGGLDGEDQVAVRAGGAFGRRLLPATPPCTGPWRPSGTVLITGGTGSLGTHVARWAAGAGAQHVVLAGRRGLDAPGAPALRDELSALGVRVTIAACDVADRTAAADLLAGMADTGVPLTAVVHAAGVLDDGVIDGLTSERFDTVWRAKVDSAVVLDELTAGLDLDAFVLFSSASGSVGNAGQANYAAANAVLDALAEQRRAAGSAATSIAWGSWAGDGMAGGPRAEESARRTGIRALPPQVALSALQRVAGGDAATTVVVDLDHERFVEMATRRRANPLLRELPGYHEPDPASTGLRDRLLELSPLERGEAVLDLVRGQVAAQLGLDTADAVGPDRAFRDLGFDSLAAVELRNILGAATGLSLPATLVFDHPSPSDLTDYLVRCLVPDGAPAPSADEARLRAFLASVPIEQLRGIGALAPLLRLASEDAAMPEDDDAVDAMDLDELVQAALENGD